MANSVALDNQSHLLTETSDPGWNRRYSISIPKGKQNRARQMGPQQSPPLIHPMLCLPLQQLFPPFCARDVPLRQWGAHKAFQASYSPPVAPGWGFCVPVTWANTGHSDVFPRHVSLQPEWDLHWDDLLSWITLVVSAVTRSHS